MDRHPEWRSRQASAYLQGSTRRLPEQDACAQAAAVLAETPERKRGASRLSIFRRKMLAFLCASYRFAQLVRQLQRAAHAPK